jgi:hypothetical protein
MKLQLAIACTILAFSAGGYGVYKSVSEHKQVSKLTELKAQVESKTANNELDQLNANEHRGLSQATQDLLANQMAQQGAQVGVPQEKSIKHHADQAAIGNYIAGGALLLQVLGFWFANRHQKEKNPKTADAV